MPGRCVGLAGLRRRGDRADAGSPDRRRAGCNSSGTQPRVQNDVWLRWKARSRVGHGLVQSLTDASSTRLAFDARARARARALEWSFSRLGDHAAALAVSEHHHDQLTSSQWHTCSPVGRATKCGCPTGGEQVGLSKRIATKQLEANELAECSAPPGVAPFT